MARVWFIAFGLGPSFRRFESCYPDHSFYKNKFSLGWLGVKRRTVNPYKFCSNQKVRAKDLHFVKIPILYLMSNYIESTEKEIIKIQTKLELGKATKEEIKTFLEYVAKLEELVEEASMEDFYGTWGWKYKVFGSKG